MFLFRQIPPAGDSGFWWSERPTFLTPGLLLQAFGGGYFRMAASVFDLGSAVGWLGAAAVVSVMTIAWLRLRRTQGSVPESGTLWVLGITLVIPFMISFFKPEVFLWYRYPVIVYPLFALMAGAVAGSGWRVGLAVGSVLLLIGIGFAGTSAYFSWSKSSARDAAEFVGELTSDSIHILIRPAYTAPLLNYYYKGNALQLDEAYLNSPLGDLVDTAHAFVYVSLDARNDIRDYMNGHFVKIAERTFPGEAHMGLVVGAYCQPPEPPDSTEGE
jgi:hypothetical protein